MEDLVRAFVIGSCCLTVILFYIGFGNIQNEVNKNNFVTQYLNLDIYRTYVIVAPIYFGLMSAITIYIHHKYKISVRKAFFIIGIISAIIVSIVITIFHIYNWSRKRYFQQYIELQIYHFIIYSGIIANLYLYLSS